MKLLVAIASYGERNLPYLRQLIAAYQAMTITVDIVVVSEAPKTLPDGVKVLVGLPSSNPWSLPFAHKPVFAENVNRYDLFLYSEDDIAVTEANIRAFLQATDTLKDDEIAGFLRYEKDKSGNVWMPDVHSMFRWEPESVVERGGSLYASFTNEHAACYIITQSQLKRAIESGGFLREPYEGKYDMICAAATDPYTSCGFRKLVCVSNPGPFLLHHLSDRYAGQVGLPATSFQEQLDVLERIHRGTHPATTLCSVESKMNRGEWSKGLYEKPRAALLEMVPNEARSVLSVGSGWGATEEEIARRGAQVATLPLDSVIGAVAAKRGLQPTYGDLDGALARLDGRTFDCVLVTNLLHLNRDPERFVSRLSALVGSGGTLVIESPNFQHAGLLGKRALGRRDFNKLRSFDESGISLFGAGTVRRWSRKAGLSGSEVAWLDHSLPALPGRKGQRATPSLGKLTAESFVFRATRNTPR